MNKKRTSKRHKSGLFDSVPSDWIHYKGKNIFMHRTQRGKGAMKVFSVTIESGLVIRSSLDRRMAPDASIESSLLIEKGDLVYNMMRMWQGALGVANGTGVVSPAYVVIRPKEMVDPQYAFYLLKSSRYLHILKSYSFGITEDRLRLYYKDFGLIPFYLPPIPEQRKIAGVLDTWDTAISKLAHLIKQKELRQKWLMQQLFSGRKRLEGFKGKWIEHRLGDFFEERNETNYPRLQLLSIGQSGVYPQSKSDKRDISNTDKSKYRRICKGDIGYNTMRMWQGRSALSTLEGIVSPAYTILKPKKHTHSLFFSYLFRTPKLINAFYRNSQGLVEDTLNCKFHDFAIIKVHLPEKDEQVAIANVLSVVDQELKIMKDKLGKLKEQKRGLMQVLLTGKKRIKI